MFHDQIQGASISHRFYVRRMLGAYRASSIHHITNGCAGPRVQVIAKPNGMVRQRSYFVLLPPPICATLEKMKGRLVDADRHARDDNGCNVPFSAWI